MLRAAISTSKPLYVSRSNFLVLFKQSFHSSAPSLSLRGYQLDANDAILDSIKRGVVRPAVAMATGGGKTVVFSHLIPQLKPMGPSQGNKTLVLAHKQELIYQAAKTIEMNNRDLEVQIDMGKLKPDLGGDVIVASVQTLTYASRLSRYDPSDFKAIIIDECHHSTANSWKKILRHFGADHAKLNIYVIGFTATMERADGMALGEVFDEIVYERLLSQMIKSRELSDVKITTIDFKVDFGKIKRQNGSKDFHEALLSQAMSTDEVNETVAGSYLKLIKENGYKSTLIFCVDIDHCLTLCGALQDHKIEAQYITGSTKADERESILNDFRNGKIRVLCSVYILTEGTDLPITDSIILARPTKSRNLLIQMVGRGLRLHPGKTHCHVLDVADTLSTGLQSVASLVGDDTLTPPKKYRDSDSGKDIDFRLLSKKENQERIRIEQEKALAEKLADEQAKELLMSIEFQTLESFAALSISDGKLVVTNKETNTLFTESKLKWIRLEYDWWGLPLPMTDKFLTIERVTSEGKITTQEFTLRLHSFASKAQKYASGFNCPDKRILAEISTDTNLVYILNKAESLARKHQVSGGQLFLKSQRQHKLCTPKQVSSVKNKLITKGKLLYKSWDDSTEELFLNGLKSFNIYRMSDLIFAIKYSINCLWVRWELQSILGHDDKDRKKITKLVKQKAK